jgi:hypothetical protein
MAFPIPGGKIFWLPVQTIGQKILPALACRGLNFFFKTAVWGLARFLWLYTGYPQHARLYGHLSTGCAQDSVDSLLTVDQRL